MKATLRMSLETTTPAATVPAAPVSMGRKLKVCLATMAPFMGGAEVAAERLALGLQGAGHDVLVVVGQTGVVKDRMEALGLRCVYSPMYLTSKERPLRYMVSRWRLRRLLKQARPDVIHSNDLPTHQMVSGASRGLNIPRICHHRFPYEARSIEWLGKYGTERHLFVSRWLMEELCAESPGMQNVPCSVVHDGLPLPAAHDNAGLEAARLQLGLPLDRVIVLFAGQIIERKGVADLIHAWDQLPLLVKDHAELVLVGDDLRGKGQYRREMEELAGSVGLRAKFMGFQKDLAPWLTAADIAVVPSHAEPLGNATLEAMSYGLPVIGTAVGGIPEMIEHERTGLLVPPHSPAELAAAIGRYCLEEEFRQACGRRGRERCARLFSLQAHTETVLREYRETIASRKG